MYLNFLAVFSLTIILSNSFYIFANQQPLCLNFYSNLYEQRIAYDVTGIDPQNIDITVYNSENRLLHQFNTARDTANIKTTNRFKVCFSTLDETEKPVSFDIWQNSTDKIKQLASKSEMLALHSSIVEASNLLRTVSEQERFQELRENIHTQIIKETEDALKSYGVLKVGIIIATIVIQVIVLRTTLKSK